MDDRVTERDAPGLDVPVYETDLVLTADGHEIGRVGATTADALQVATSHARDVWVSRGAIARRDEVAQALYLRCARQELNACRVPAPR